MKDETCNGAKSKKTASAVNTVNTVEQMGIANPKLDALDNSVEINNLFSAFAAAQKHAILRVLSAENEKERNTLAAQFTDDVNRLFQKTSGGGPKCPEGTKFNPLTGQCE